ncbi:ribonuclease inhibitor-like [Colossoma macropomum]|uniref:ribonuclease inhibitor-like n=1 Tax=Colossoma macropomum TaxID=42526 RepID=UPI001863A42D|nr:ribonuclease inhibitor-like [Colossoma macropomum]
MSSSSAHTTPVQTSIPAQTEGNVHKKEELDVFYINMNVLRTYEQPEKCLLELLPRAETFRKVVLCECSLSEESCAALASALRNSSAVRELDLSKTELQDSGEELLSAALENPHGKLEKLRLFECNLTWKSCEVLALVLSSTSTKLRELDLSKNKLQDLEVNMLSIGLQNPHCQLEILRLEYCDFTKEGWAALFEALKSNPSHMKELNLSNIFLFSGMDSLSALLKDPYCKLEKLQLEYCNIKDEGCATLIEALKSNPSLQLRELNLSWNDPGQSGLKKLSDLLEDPHCKLEKLELESCGIKGGGCAALVEALKSNPSSHLRELNLSNNNLGDSGAKALSDLLKDPHCKLEKLQLSHCKISGEDCAALDSALKSNPSSHLRELDLSCNHRADIILKQICDLVKDPQW